MHPHAAPDAGPPVPLSAAGTVFRRLLGMLRPYRAMIGLAWCCSSLSMPCELFPAFIWQYVTDDLILKGISRPSSPGLQGMMSLGGRIHGLLHLLLSALVWLYLIYIVGELTGTLSTVLLQRTAQKFVYVLRNQASTKTPEPEPRLPPAPAHRRSHEPRHRRRR
jgi:ABC-type multidrug transport system fused ATPase/permease subunit